MNRVGQRRFESEEKRCAECSPSYERSHLFCRLSFPAVKN